MSSALESCDFFLALLATNLIMMKRNILISLTILFAVAGAIVLIYFIYALGKSGFKLTYPIDLTNTSMVGTFIGGTVGVFWSAASVLLFFMALDYQKDQLNISKYSNDLQNFISVYPILLESFNKTVDDLNETDYLPLLSDKLVLDEPGRGFSQIYRQFDLYKERTGLKPSFNECLKSFGDSRLSNNFFLFGEKFFQLHKCIEEIENIYPNAKLLNSFKSVLLAERTEEQIIALIFYSKLSGRLEILRSLISVNFLQANIKSVIIEHSYLLISDIVGDIKFNQTV